jgi:hypothetical protein
MAEVLLFKFKNRLCSGWLSAYDLGISKERRELVTAVSTPPVPGCSTSTTGGEILSRKHARERCGHTNDTDRCTCTPWEWLE